MSPEGGTEAPSGTSERSAGPDADPDTDAEQGTDMTAVTSDPRTDPLSRALAERAELIRLCLYALDRARSSGVVERLVEGLDGVGVAALRPDGERFDPAHHEAGGTVPTDDPQLDGVIAETEVVGFADRDRLLRAPIVTVYQSRPEPPRPR
ncbi:nucleotide exchange factor GrpE [Saccharopolyspora rosea]|uniref:nucleotide exchange factor GrpE n=1 Tax=Saccharopolyspora rosea TaxID=524884 RepID=UPI003CD07B39